MNFWDAEGRKNREYSMQREELMAKLKEGRECGTPPENSKLWDIPAGRESGELSRG